MSRIFYSGAEYAECDRDSDRDTSNRGGDQLGWLLDPKRKPNSPM